MPMKNNEKGTVSVGLVNEAVMRARAHGVDTQPITAAAGITSQMLAQPYSRASSAQYGALWAGITQAMDDEFFGQDAHPMRSGSFVTMVQAALTARTGRQALARATGFLRPVLDDLHVRVGEDDQRVRLVFEHRKGTRVSSMFTYITWLIMVYRLVCWLVGRRIPFITARFRYAAPQDAQEYRLVFCDDMAFKQDASYVDPSPAFLNLPVTQTTVSIKTFLRGAPGSFIVKYRNPDSLAVRMCKMLRDFPVASWPASDAMTLKLSVAEVTMRRRLKFEGHTYQSIKDDLRRDIAIGQLQDTHHAIADIAAAVGFAEPSVFHRAFRKWAGTRPTGYRMERWASSRSAMCSSS